MKIFNPSLQNTEISGSVSLTDSVTGSLLIELTSSLDDRYPSITLFNEYTQSANLTTGSSNDRLNNIESFSSSVNTKFDTLKSYTGSNDTTNFTQNDRLDLLSIESGSSIGRLNNLEVFTSSINTTIKNELNSNTVVSGSSQIIEILSSLNSYTSSNDTTNTTQNSRLDQLSIESGSTINKLINLELFSGSQNTKNDSIAAYTSSVVTKFSTLQFYTSSNDTKFNTLEFYTSSIDAKLNIIGFYTSSIDSKFSTLSTYTESNDTTNAIQNSRLDQLSIVSESTISRLVNIESFTSSINTSIKTQLDVNNVISSSEQLTTEFDTRYLNTGADGVVSGSEQVVGILSSINTYTGSNDTTNTTQNDRLDQLSTASGSTENRLNNIEIFSGSQNQKNTTIELYTSSLDSKFSTLSTYTSSNDTTNSTQNDRLEQLSTVSGSMLNRLSNIEAFSGSVNTKFDTLATYSGSVDSKFSTLSTYTASNDTTNTTQNSRLDQLSTVSGSVIDRLDSIETFSGSIHTKFDTLLLYTSSVDDKFNTLSTYTSSNETTNTTQTNRLDFLSTFSGSTDSRLANIESNSGSYARTDTNNSFVGLQTFNNISVNGTASFAYIQSTTGSAKIIGDAFIILNNNVPSEPFAGIKVIDSGSVNVTSSLLWDGNNNHWIYENISGSSYGAAGFMGGPRSTDINNILYPTQYKVLRSQGGDHLYDSNITDNDTNVEITIPLNVTSDITASGVVKSISGFDGDLAGNASTATTASYVDYLNVANKPTLVSGSSQVIDILSSLNTYTGSNDTTNTTQNDRLDQLSTTSGSVIGRLNNIEAFTSSIDATIKTKLNVEGVISGSSQLTASYDLRYVISGSITQTTWDNIASKPAGIVSGSSQINYCGISGIPTNIVSSSTDSTTVDFTISNGSITANLIGGVVSGSCQIDAASTLNWITNVKTRLNVETVVSGSSQVAINSTSGSLNVNKGGTGQTSYVNGELLIGNTTGNTLTKSTLTGTSNQITVTNGAGSITLSTPQNIHTTACIQFGSLGVGTAASTTTGEIRATNEITAYYSDDRLKTKLGKIENPLTKVNELNGYYFIENELAKSLGYSNDNRQVGVSAQEVQIVLPEVVTTAPISDEYLTVRYDRLVPLLIEAVKEQNNIVQTLVKEVEDLKNVLNNRG